MTQGPLPYWPPGTKVRLRTDGREGTIEGYLMDGFYTVVIETPGETIERITPHVEDLEVIK
jgi:hypothetical protein